MVVTAEIKRLKILLIEDNPRDVRLIREILSEERNGSFELEWVDSLSQGIARLEQGGIDAVLLDLSLPDSKWSDTFSKIYAHAPAVPIVVLTGTQSHSFSLEMLKHGAEDYLVKGEVDGSTLVRALDHAIARRIKRETRQKFPV